MVTCRLTACAPGSTPGPTLGTEYGKAFTFLILCQPALAPCPGDATEYGICSPVVVVVDVVQVMPHRALQPGQIAGALQ